MKKVFLTMAVAGLVTVTSCDKKANETVETTTETPISTTEDNDAVVTTEMEATTKVDVPNFSNSDVQSLANDYAEFVAEMTAAANAGDQTKLTELQAKNVDFAQKIQQTTQKMTPEDAQLWKEWYEKLSAATGQ